MSQNDIHSLLPVEAQLLLKRAASTQLKKGDYLAKRRAVDNAIEKVKRDYPEYFQTTGDFIESKNNQSANSKRSTDDATE